MAPKLYMTIASSSVRSVLLCAKALEIELEQIEVNLFNKEHLLPSFIKINPLHTLPTLVEEDGWVLYDSHAIMTYLVEKYGKDECLYPKDLRKRAIIDQRLHFESSVLFIRGSKIAKSIIFHEAKDISQESIEKLLESYGFLEIYLSNNKWVAGDEMSVADFCTVTSITAWNVLVPIEESKYPNIISWIKHMEQLPYYNEVNAVGLEMFKTLIHTKLST